MRPLMNGWEGEPGNRTDTIDERESGIETIDERLERRAWEL